MNTDNGGRCLSSNEPIFTDDGRVTCPDCGQLVRWRRLCGLWFVVHDSATGEELNADG